MPKRYLWMPRLQRRMQFMTHKRNVEGVLAHAKAKSKKASEKVENAIKEAIKEKRVINFNNIAKSANVSKSYLYNNKEYRERIESLRKQQSEVKSTKSIKYNTNDKSKDTIIESLRYRIKWLEKENKNLTEENKQLLGQLYEQL